MSAYLSPERWMRSGEYDRCRHCGRNDRPHEGLGLCYNCYGYHRDPDGAKARRKASRLRNNTVAKQYERVRAWHERNAEKVREYKRRYHEAHRQPRWPVGMTVWYELCGFWCAGRVIERPNNCTIIIKLKGGTIVRTSARKLRRSKPPEAA